MNIPDHIIERAASYGGDIRKLDDALGAYVLGQLYGWRVLYLAHSQAQLRKLETILGITSFSDVCPERTSLSRKSVGLSIVDAGTGFWAVIKGSKYRDVRPVVESAGTLL